MNVKTAIGVMSGTSLDGVDVTVVRTDGETVFDSAPSAFLPYERETKAALRQAIEDAKAMTARDQRPGVLREAETMVTNIYGRFIAERFLPDAGINPASIDVIGLHGQTVLHRPAEGMTVQLGDGAEVARITGIPVVHDLRANDMAHGGQGAPLVPVYHQALARSLDARWKRVAFVNVGGISNVTYVGDELVAFDTGPGNVLIDQWVQANLGIDYDSGGLLAGKGRVIPELADRYLSQPFFAEKPPKSLDRLDFDPLEVGVATVEDGARTLVHVSARSIARSLDHLPEAPDLWIVCGGGAFNPVLMEEISAELEPTGAHVASATAFGFSADMLEAGAWGFLAVRSLLGLPITFPTTTGCRKPVSGGVLSLPPQRA